MNLKTHCISYVHVRVTSPQYKGSFWTDGHTLHYKITGRKFQVVFYSQPILILLMGVTKPLPRYHRPVLFCGPDNEG